MGRTLAVLLAALALAGAAYFVLAGGEDERGDGFDALAEREDGAAGQDPAGPGLKSGGAPASPALPEGPKRFTVTGTVVTADGEPAAGVPVVARYTGKARNRNDPASYIDTPEERFAASERALTQPADVQQPIAGETRTDEAGAFVIALAEPGQYRVGAQPGAPRFGTYQHVGLHADQPTHSAALRVLDGHPLAGRVLDTADKPVAATLSLTWGSTHLGERRSWQSAPVEAGASGAFAFAAVPEGTLHFTLYLPGGRRISGIRKDAPHEGELVIRVPATGGRVQGTVRDGAGQGIADAVILLGMQGPAGADGAAGRTRCKAVTDGAGAYALDDAPLGRVTSVQARAQGFLTYTESAARLAAGERKVVEGTPLTLDITLSRGGTVQGRVVDKAGGAAIAGARVRLFASGGVQGTTPVRTAICDANGRYAFEAVAVGRHVALPDAPGYYLPQVKPTAGASGWANPVGMPGQGAPAALTIVMTDDGVLVERDLELARGFAVQGRVVDAAGAGVGGAAIHARGYGLQSIGWQWGLGGMAKEPLATSQAGGRFSVEGLPPKADWVLFATKEGYAGVYGTPFAAGEEAQPPELTLKVEAAATVRGKVVDESGEGIAGVQVRYWGRTQELTSERTPVKTGPGGGFEVSLPSGNWMLNVWAQGRTGKQQQVKGLTPGEVREGVVITIAAGVEVRGIVVDKDDEPVSRLQLMLRPLSGMSSWNSTMTGEDGRFTFSGAKAGRAQLYTFQGGRQVPLGKPFDAPADDLRIEHERAVSVRIRGEVRGPDGTPIPLSSVRVSAGGGGARPAAPPPVAPGMAGGTDAINGAFEILAHGTGPWTVRVSAPRDADGKPMNLMPGRAVVEDAAAPVVVTLARGLEIAGAVVDAEGKGLAEVLVGASSTRVLTNANGRFRLSGLTKGKHALLVTPPAGFVRPAAQHVEAGTRDLRIELQAGLEITGKAVGPGGKALAQGWVQAAWGTAGKPPHGSASTQLGPGGAFTLDGIPDGVSVKVTVQVWDMSGGSAYAPKVIENVRPGTRDLEVRLGEGLTIEGVVLGADGKPTGGCYVYGMALEGNKQTGYVQVGDDGLFELAGLAPGRYRIQVMRMGGGATPAPMAVDAPARGVRLKLPRSAQLRGRVEGLPEGSVRWRVQAVDADGLRLATVLVQEDGSWSFDAIRDGAAVWLHLSGYRQEHYATKGPVQPGSEGVVLRAKKGGTIAGTVAGGPGADSSTPMYVSAEGERGWRSAGSVDKDGAFVVKGLPPGTYTLKVRSSDNSYKGELAGVRDGATGVRVTVEAR